MNQTRVAFISAAVLQSWQTTRKRRSVNACAGQRGLSVYFFLNPNRDQVKALLIGSRRQMHGTAEVHREVCSGGWENRYKRTIIRAGNLHSFFIRFQCTQDVPDGLQFMLYQTLLVSGKCSIRKGPMQLYLPGAL